MNYKTIDLGGARLVADAGAAALYLPDGKRQHVFDLDSLGVLAEWLAVAWENVAGEEYKPVVITERGYVADAGLGIPVETTFTAEIGAPGSVPLYFGEGPDRKLIGSAVLGAATA